MNLFKCEVEYNYIMSVLKRHEVYVGICDIVDRMSMFEDRGERIKIEIGCYDNNFSHFEYLIHYAYTSNWDIDKILLSGELQYPDTFYNQIMWIYDMVRKGQLCYILSMDYNIRHLQLENKFSKMGVLHPDYAGGIALKVNL